MKVGKLPAQMLGDLLTKVKLDDRVVVGPSVGVDSAVIDYGDTLLVVKTDPITFATDEIGWYAVNVNANDVAMMGAEPKWFLATILVPPETGEDAVERIFDQMLQACQGLGVSLVGGHTEITHDLGRPIVIGCMLGEVARDRLVKPGGAKPGDVLILTKGIAVEGTAILARELETRLANAGVAAEILESAKGLIHQPGISVVPEARAVMAVIQPTAMHDPTEGGLATGLRELAIGSQVGLEICQDRIPVLDETRVICDSLGLDPMGLIASGSLLLAVGPGDTEQAVAAIVSIGVQASVIGRVVARDQGIRVSNGVALHDLPVFERDEIARVFE